MHITCVLVQDFVSGQACPHDSITTSRDIDE